MKEFFDGEYRRYGKLAVGVFLFPKYELVDSLQPDMIVANIRNMKQFITQILIVI